MIIKGNDQFTTADYPSYMDGTSLGLTVIRAKVEMAASEMDEMLELVNEDGIIQVIMLSDYNRLARHITSA